MDDLGNLTNGQTAAVFLAFLQADCYTANSEYSDELFCLSQDFDVSQDFGVTRDINYNGPRKETLDGGHLETDGHLSSSIHASLSDIQPSVELEPQGNHAGAAAIQQVAEGLRDIAAQLEHDVVAQATQNLSRNLLNSPTTQWGEHIIQEVNRVMRQGVVGLEHAPQERVIVALTLTLVKGVCEQAPRLLRTLFNVALQCISWGR
ncbi:hypothetical protein GBF38_020220 [Nibea albiflora]|uniref:Uncharacterized protein n=1 Tax=Nibea albiflora TaxID=240163 RepID=A0ACB7FD83_NIBAL|nr:hypothetical protein GBF38_020220 [Nibea albiflora]